MKNKEIELRDDGKQMERFVDFTKKLISVPKEEIDRRLEQERQEKASKTEAKKQRS